MLQKLLLNFQKKYQKQSSKINFFHEIKNSFGNTVVGPAEYTKNAIVYKCLKLISESASHVQLIILTKDVKTGKLIRNKNHIYNQLLRRPNPLQGGADFFTRVITNKLLYGESYILMIQSPVNSKKIELHLIDNQNISPIVENGRIEKYQVDLNINGKKKVIHYLVDPISNQSQILHLTNYNPLNPLRGLSCLSPASKAIKLHNKAIEWNNMLLNNGARPSGALVIKDSNRYLSTEEFDRLKTQIQDKYSSHNNAGRPLILEGGLDWKEMSMSPKDMDFAESKDAAAREIALACGIPPQLLGIKGDNTYSNMQEARIALWEETIIPLLDNLADALTSWLIHWSGEEFIIDFDRDSISAITTRRDNLWAKINNVTFMTINEKRELLGLPPINNGETLE